MTGPTRPGWDDGSADHRFRVVPAAYVLLRREGQVLLQLRRGTGFMDGFWAAGAAGHVEAGESVLDAAVRDVEAMDGLARTLAQAIANLDVAFDPDLIVLGGYLRQLFDAREELVTDTVRALAFRPDAEAVQVARGLLGRNRLLIGAGERAYARLLADPAGVPLVAL